MKGSERLGRVVHKFRREGAAGVWHAVRKRLRPLLAGLRLKPAPGGAYTVLYIVGCREGESRRYRVDNLAEALAPLGVAADAAAPEELAFRDLSRYALAVFFRCEWNRLTETLTAKCRAAGVPTVFDVDDLVFDEAITGEIDAFRELDAEGQYLYLAGVRGYRAMLEACDYATASTDFLCRYMERLTGKPSFRIPNGVNRLQIRKAAAARRDSPDGRQLGYLSGSRTHRKDFAQAAPALVRVLQRHPDVTLTVVGHLELPECLHPVRGQVRQLPFVPYASLPEVCAGFYAVIVPLEYDTAFCQAKSELKYFEQALLGIPVIASPTEPYAACVEEGRTGFLAADEAEWEEKLEGLLASPALRDTAGRAAAEQIRGCFYPEAVGRRAKAVYDAILLRAARARMDPGCLRVAFVIPEPVEGAGGHRNIFRAARAFVQRGHRVVIYTEGDTGRFRNAKALERFVTRHFFATGAAFVLGCADIAPCDLLIATQWKTAYVVREFRHRCVLPGYFIQDFEPYFYPMGEEYIQAYATYGFGFAPLASGRWAAEWAEKQSGRRCPYFQFPIQREIYKERPEIRRETNMVLFFARTQMPRRCFPLGVEALRRLSRERPGVRIVFWGENGRNYGDYGFPYENMGILKDLDALARLYCTAAVGLCFSLTNPSLVPYEMMACGLPVVDLDFNGRSASYGGRDAAVLAEPTPEAVCRALCQLLDRPAERELRRKNGLRLTGQMPDEAETEAFIVHHFEQMLSGKEHLENEE